MLEFVDLPFFGRSIFALYGTRIPFDSELGHNILKHLQSA
nr:MAG TPA: hypothetical protein [Caudoviricetes sp.]